METWVSHIMFILCIINTSLYVIFEYVNRINVLIILILNKYFLYWAVNSYNTVYYLPSGKVQSEDMYSVCMPIPYIMRYLVM